MVRSSNVVLLHVIRPTQFHAVNVVPNLLAFIDGKILRQSYTKGQEFRNTNMAMYHYKFSYTLLIECILYMCCSLMQRLHKFNYMAHTNGQKLRDSKMVPL